MADSQDTSRNELTEHLADVAENLTQAEHLDPKARHELAELLRELGQHVATAALPPEEIAHLKASATHLSEALHQPPPHGLLTSATERLEQVVIVTETRAPILSDITRRLIDVLTSIGI